MSQRIFFLIGPCCSGKGTILNLIKKTFNYKGYSAGDILRDKFPIGHETRTLIDKGNIVDSNIINDSIKSIINNSNETIIIDGYPRTIDQINFLKTLNIKKIYICMTYPCDCCPIKLFCKRALLDRTLNRYYCKYCHTTFNKISICCNNVTIKRLDDIKDIFEKRYKLFIDNFYNDITNLVGPIYFISNNTEANETLKKIKFIF